MGETMAVAVSAANKNAILQPAASCGPASGAAGDGDRRSADALPAMADLPDEFREYRNLTCERPVRWHPLRAIERFCRLDLRNPAANPPRGKANRPVKLDRQTMSEE
jgi:hypothetical protein